MFDQGQITDEERRLLADRPRLHPATALAYASGVILVVLGAGLVGAVWGLTPSPWLRALVITALAAALAIASGILRRRRILAAALALCGGALALGGAAIELAGTALWPVGALVAPVVESVAFLALTAGVWSRWRSPLLTGVMAIACYLVGVTSARLLLGHAAPSPPLMADIEMVLAALLVASGAWMNRTQTQVDHAFWPCLVGLASLDIAMLATGWAGTVQGWWLAVVQALLVLLFARLGRTALSAVAVFGTLGLLSRQISGQLLPAAPFAASALSIVVAGATLILGTAYLRRHPLLRPLDRGSIWWAPSDQ